MVPKQVLFLLAFRLYQKPITYMRILVLSLLFLTVFCGCQKNGNNKGGYAYFGGQIINPNNDYVLLLSPSHKFDTLFLDDHNRFFTKIEELETGLYTFTHGGEYQMALLEPYDSVMLRLNTIDFDESLVFTGDGAKKNNFLIKLFLDNEKDQESFVNTAQLSPENFQIYVDSARTARLNEFSEFISKKQRSDLFKDIAETSINYSYYSIKEMYPFAYFGYRNLKNYQNLPESFYDFRNDINYNNGALSDFFIYNRFLYSHFNNVALDAFYKNASNEDIFDRHSVVYNLEKLKLMDERISNDTIKNKLLKNTTRDFISMCEDSVGISKMIDAYLTISTSAKDKEYIKGLASAIKKLKPGKTIPEVTLINYDNETIELRDLITKPSVIYFWSSNLKLHYKNTHFKSLELGKKYPNVDFIAININDNDNRYWKKTLDEFKFSTANEYQFDNPTEGKQILAINTIYKMIVLDKDMKIVDIYYNMFQSSFEEMLKNLNN